MKYTDTFLDLFFLCGGIIRSTKYRNRKLFATVAFMTAFVIGELGNLVGLVNTSTLVAKSETVTYLVGYILCLILCYCIKNNEQTLINFVDDFQRYQLTSSSIRSQLEIVSKRYLLNVFVPFYISLAVYIVPIIALPLFVEDATKYGTNILLPHWYECPNDNSTYLNGRIMKHMCWRINSNFRVIASNLLQLTLSVILLFPILCTTIFCLIVQHYGRAYCDFLKRKLRELHGKTDEEIIRSSHQDGTCEKQAKWKTLHLFRRELVETMKHYQFLYRSMRKVTRYLNFLALVSIVPSFVINVFLLFINVKGGGKDKSSIIPTIRNTSNISATCVLIFTFCNIVENLKQMNEIIFQEVCNLPWYETPIETRKLIRQFLIILNKPIEIICFGSLVPNLNFFLRFTRSGYTALNFLIITILK